MSIQKSRHVVSSIAICRFRLANRIAWRALKLANRDFKMQWA